MPMMAFIGVRISWLMLARNSPLAPAVACSAPARDVELLDQLRQPLGVLSCWPGRSISSRSAGASCASCGR